MDSSSKANRLLFLTGRQPTSRTALPGAQNREKKVLVIPYCWSNQHEACRWKPMSIVYVRKPLCVFAWVPPPPSPFLVFFPNNCTVPLGFPPWEIRLALQLQSRAIQTYGACCVFYCFQNPPNSDMDNRIFNVRTDVNACDCTRRCTDTVREAH